MFLAEEANVMDAALLTLRLVVGLLLAGHGAQKLFGWFGGHGIAGTAGWLESMRFRPARLWAWLAGLAEFVGGVLFAAGVVRPRGPVGIAPPVLPATGRARWPKVGAAAPGCGEPPTRLCVSLARCV